MAVFDVKVYFDTVCPWCYIGHKSLDNAIALFQKTYPGSSRDKFHFTYRPYYVNPSLPVPGVPWAEVVARKNGEERVNAIRTRLARVGREHGIDFRFAKVGHSRDSHRLVQRFGNGTESGSDDDDEPLQKRLVEAIYRMHFEHVDTDLASRDDLTAAAVEAGLLGVEVGAFLDGGDGADEVDEMVAAAKEAGVTGVPTVEINGKRVIGAKDVSAFYEALVEAKGAQGEQE